MKFNQRLDRLSEYPFARLAALIADIPAPEDGGMILSIGEPQHASPALLTETAAAQAHLWNKYPPVNGTPDHRAAVAEWATRRYGLPDGMVEADRHVLPVAGTREALFMLGQIAIPTDATARTPLVAMPNPFYQVYLGAAVMNGAEPLMLTAGADTGFLPDVAGLPGDVLDRLAIVYYCSPANPQGAVATLEQWKTLVRLARDHDFLLVADECYSEIWRDAPPPGALDACRELGGDLSNVVVFNSLSKRSSVPGLRSGFVLGDADVIARFARLRSYSAAGTALPLLAAAAALWRDEAHVEENRALYQAKMAAADRILGPKLGLDKVAPAGGFFLWLDVGDGEAVTRRLWAEAGIKVLPGRYLTVDEADGSNAGAPYIRIALVHDQQKTEAALTRIAEVL
ncbi:N-succinyl-L,L-diaminopimelate aminotransferase alternative [Caenispirillum salinarum AK4]|uniref:N-succinyl-L,L-diaminopimelate aminotransferase alternative n=1 Tax=Caenispirillum salinarum AK4 TaxID=1238182 RepID=K9H308_9PROT|nr:aminotransferase class I/II-fold pyridoxal phosphate-dependent enzyme [Caenispirillum salinarum]EKV31967.1 N-succinyl-L,L-diaminopimelate aminotransferase alternative [Caenispirillum salinarum AK4]